MTLNGRKQPYSSVTRDSGSGCSTVYLASLCSLHNILVNSAKYSLALVDLSVHTHEQIRRHKGLLVCLPDKSIHHTTSVADYSAVYTSQGYL